MIAVRSISENFTARSAHSVQAGFPCVAVVTVFVQAPHIYLNHVLVLFQHSFHRFGHVHKHYFAVVNVRWMNAAVVKQTSAHFVPYKNVVVFVLLLKRIKSIHSFLRRVAQHVKRARHFKRVQLARFNVR